MQWSVIFSCICCCEYINVFKHTSLWSVHELMYLVHTQTRTHVHIAMHNDRSSCYAPTAWLSFGAKVKADIVTRKRFTSSFYYLTVVHGRSEARLRVSFLLVSLYFSFSLSLSSSSFPPHSFSHPFFLSSQLFFYALRMLNSYQPYLGKYSYKISIYATSKRGKFTTPSGVYIILQIGMSQFPHSGSVSSISLSHTPLSANAFYIYSSHSHVPTSLVSPRVFYHRSIFLARCFLLICNSFVVLFFVVRILVCVCFFFKSNSFCFFLLLMFPCYLIASCCLDRVSVRTQGVAATKWSMQHAW